MPSCSEIGNNIVRDCDLVLEQGVAEMAYLGRLSWVSAFTFDGTNGKIVTGITMKTGKKLLHLEGVNLSHQFTTGFTESEFGNSRPQTFRFIAFTNDPDDEAELDKYLDLRDMFAIVKQNGRQGQYKIIGLDTGMRMSGSTSDSNDATTLGGYTINLTAPNEKKLPYTLIHKTSNVVDTDAFIETIAKALS